MTERHFTRRRPKKKNGLTWCRIPSDRFDAVTYRLFRRDMRGAVHMSSLSFGPAACRDYIAGRLRQACRALRDRVDEIDLRHLEHA